MITLFGKTMCESCFSENTEDPCGKCGFSPSEYQPDSTALPIGQKLQERYLIGGVIGKGGFGITYTAFDTKLERRVAIKEYYPYGLALRSPGTTMVSAPDADSSEVFGKGAEKFYDEARLVAKFSDNQNIVSIHDFFYENSTVYYVMEYLQGQSMKRYIEKHGVVSSEQAVYIAKEVSNALVSSHSANVLHRDISPDNIMLCNNGKVKLIDFGAARQVISEGSQSLSVILKQGFAPLEQYQKKGKQGPWTDIYALGATIYYLTTGDVLDDPMSRLDDDEALSSNVYGINDELWDVIKKSTMLKPKDRYKDIFEFREALNRIAVGSVPLTATYDNSIEILNFITENPSISATAPAKESAPIGATMPVKEAAPIGATMPVKEAAPIGATMPVKEAAPIGATMPVKEAAPIGATMPVKEAAPIGATMPVKEAAPIRTAMPVKEAAPIGATMPVKESAAAVAEMPEKKKKKTLIIVAGLVAAAIIIIICICCNHDTEPKKPEQEAIPATVNIGGETYDTNMSEKLYLNNQFSGKKLTNSDIIDLKYMTNITELDLSHNNISDISALENLTQLTELDLSYNDISNISALKDMTELTELNLGNNNFYNIYVLKNMTKLTKLDLGFNKITDISVLENMTELTYLDLEFNDISDFSVLKNLTNLKSLDITYNYVSYHLDNADKIKKFLDEADNKNSAEAEPKKPEQEKPEEPEPQKPEQEKPAETEPQKPEQQKPEEPEPKKPEQKKSEETEPPKTEPQKPEEPEPQKPDQEAIPATITIGGETYETNMSGRLNLREKELTNSDITDLKYMTNITELDLRFNNISDISALENLTQLTKLDLGKNNITDISALKNIAKFTYLDLGYNNISDISVLENMTELTTLGLCGNDISNISALKNMTQLTELYLGDNNISDISVLKKLTKLDCLEVTYKGEYYWFNDADEIKKYLDKNC